MLYLVVVMDHFEKLHQCSSSMSESSDHSNFLLNPNHFDLESPPKLSPHSDNFIPNEQGLLDSLPPNLSPEDHYKFRDLLFPPKSRENLCCHSEVSVVTSRPGNLSTRLSQSCGQLAVQKPLTLTSVGNYQLSCDSQCLPVTARGDNYSQSRGPFDSHLRGRFDGTPVANLSMNDSHAVLAPMVTESFSVHPSVAPVSKQIGRSGLFCPSYFMGMSNEDPRQFIQDLQLWASFHQLDEKSMISAFQLLLRGSAAVWFKTVPKTFTNFQELSKLFIERYTIFDKPWKEIGLLWEMRQLPSQNVHDFVAEIQCRGDRLQLSPDTVFQIVLHGLLPSVKNCVLQKGVRSIEELLQSAALYHIASDSLPDSNADVLNSLAELKQQVQRLSIQSASSLAPMQSNTLREGYCADAGQFMNSDLSQHRGSHVYNNRCADYRRQPRCVSTTNSFGPSMYTPFKSNCRPFVRQTSVTSQSRFRSNSSQRPQQFDRNISTSHVTDCMKCGRSHRLIDRCPAFGLRCRICLGLGHFARCCRKAKLSST